MENKELIEAIIAYRARNGITQKEFAKMVGITHANMCYIETGKTKRPNQTTVYKIMQVINSEVL